MNYNNELVFQQREQVILDSDREIVSVKCLVCNGLRSSII